MEPARHLRLLQPIVEPTTAREFTERRYHVQFGPPIFGCRVCWVRTAVTADRVEFHGGRTYHRCPECDGSSLIREDDVHLL